MAGHRKLFGALAGIALLTSSLAAQSDTRPTVAVMYFNNGALGARNSELEPLSKGIADMMITQLAANPAIRVVERDQIQKLLEEQGLTTSGKVDQETAVRVGKLLGVHHMVFGGFMTTPNGKQLNLTARAVKVETGEIEYVSSDKGETDGVMETITRLSDKLNSGMKLPPMARTVREASVEKAKKVPFQAVMLYSRALSEKDKGNTAEAVQLFKASLVKFPEYTEAQRELDKLSPKSGD
jgi:curli biogenesis system outer membrane secretion channel CsgG